MEVEALDLLRAAEDHDRNGRETEAVLLYERAIDVGLPVAELAGALHGLGSTCRALGRYDEAVCIFDHAMRRFSEDASFGSVPSDDALQSRSVERSDFAAARDADYDDGERRHQAIPARHKPLRKRSGSSVGVTGIEGRR